MGTLWHACITCRVGTPLGISSSCTGQRLLCCTQRIVLHARLCNRLCVCVCVRVPVCVCACRRACVRARACLCMHERIELFGAARHLQHSASSQNCGASPTRRRGRGPLLCGEGAVGPEAEDIITSRTPGCGAAAGCSWAPHHKEAEPPFAPDVQTGSLGPPVQTGSVGAVAGWVSQPASVVDRAGRLLQPPGSTACGVATT